MMNRTLWVLFGIGTLVLASACTRDSGSAPQVVEQPAAEAPAGAPEAEAAAAPAAAPEPQPVPAIADAVAQAEADAEGPEDWIIWADGDPWDGPAPLTVEFECDLMEEVPDPKYEWDFGDGSPISTESHPVHTYTQPGRYTAKCKVTDPEGGVGEDEIIIDVEPADEAAQAAPGGES